MGKFRKFMSSQLLWCCVLILPCFCVASQYDLENLGKAAKGRLGSLYHLRNKLVRSPVSIKDKSSKTDQHFSTSARRILYSPSESNLKENRGYSYHHSSSDITNPMFAQSYSTRDFHSRMGKVSDSISSKWKSPEKVDKYIKYAYKLDGNNDNGVNSFNIHQLDMKNNASQDSKGKAKHIGTNSVTPSILISTGSTTTVSTTAGSVLLPTKKPMFMESSGLDMSPIKAISQGLNSAMTTVLTQKLMGIIDQEVPQGFLNPLKHLVSSGQRMVEFWDKRTVARDGKAPGIVEMFGYGIDQLKKYRDGQPMSPNDPIANLTSASKAMIQGMMVVKKLTNRVLGYDTDEPAAVESRGGYDHGGWGWGGHHVSYGHYLDPYAILATLGFGVFLFNVIFNLLNNAPGTALPSGRSLDVADIDIPLALSDIVSNGDPVEILCKKENDFEIDRGIGGLDPFALLAALAFGAFLLQLLLTLLNTSQRSLDVVDINVPLLMSDYHVPNIMTRMDKIFGTPTIRSRRSLDDDNSLFNTVVDKLEGMYKVYKTVTENVSCAKLYMCRAAIQNPIGEENSLFSQFYTLGLGQLSGDLSTVSWIKSIKRRVDSGEDVDCESEVKDCEE